MNSIRVLIIDDHPMVRRGLRMILEEQPEIIVVGEAGSINEAIALLENCRPTVVTLDLAIPGSSGVASVQRLRASSPETRIVVVTMHDEAAYVRSALAMGASGFVHKSAADTELVAAIRSVAKGRVFIDIGRADTIESAFMTGGHPAPEEAPIDLLSDREREVLRRVAMGETSRYIADDIGLSVKTIESYRARLMKKLGLRDRADLVRFALEAGLVDGAGPAGETPA